MRTICTVVWRDRHWVEWIGSVFCRTLLYLPNLLATLQIEIKELRSQVLNGYACKQGRIMFKQNDDDMQAGCTAFRHRKTHFASTSGQFLQQCQGSLLTTILSGGHFKTSDLPERKTGLLNSWGTMSWGSTCRTLLLSKWFSKGPVAKSHLELLQ